MVDSKHVIFNHQKPIKIDPIECDTELINPRSNIPAQAPTTEVPPVTKIKADSITESDTKSNCSSDSKVLVEYSLRPTLQDHEKILKPDRYSFLSEKLPKLLEEAMKYPEWRKSVTTKFNTIEDQNVWEDANDSKVTNPLNTVPVFKIKTNTHDKSPTYKTRLCVQGFGQRYGLDDLKTYAPTGKVALL